MKRKSLSFFMPCYNEEENIEKAIQQALKILKKTSDDYELLIIDDGSTDKSRQIVHNLAKQNKHIKLVEHPTNLGYGAALNSGISAAQKSYTFYTDADHQFDLNSLPRVFKQITSNEMIIGFRNERQDSIQRLIMSKAYHYLCGLLFDIWVQDVNCSFKLFPTQLYKQSQLQSKTVFIDAEMLIRARRAGYTITQIPIQHYRRIRGKSKFELGKKGVFMIINPHKVYEIITEIVTLFPSLRG